MALAESGHERLEMILGTIAAAGGVVVAWGLGWQILHTSPLTVTSFLEQPEPRLGIEVCNTGKHPLRIVALRLRLGRLWQRKRELELHDWDGVKDPKFPRILTPGEAWTISLPLDGFLDDLVLPFWRRNPARARETLRLAVLDERGRRYLGVIHPEMMVLLENAFQEAASRSKASGQ